MEDSKVTVQELKDTVFAFIKERDWHQFHTPKNVSMSIAIEAAELMEKFQWIDDEGSKKMLADNRQEIEHEFADVLAYLLSFANTCDIDISAALKQKMELNRKKYPVDKSKGRSTKYNQL